MAVRVCFRVPRQLQFRHDSSNHVLVSENATVGEERESPSLRVVNYPPTWGLFVFHFLGDQPVSLVLFPHFGMTPRIGQVISVWLCFAERRAVDKRLVVNEPKDTHSRLSRPCGCLALSAFMRFLHWLMFAADRSDVGGIFRVGALSQSSRDRAREYRHHVIVVSREGKVIAHSPSINFSTALAVLQDGPLLYGIGSPQTCRSTP